jgi:predicted deacylase
VRLQRHPLAGCAPGTARELLSLHYGPAAGAGKAVIQASLHADEVPGLLVAQHLRGRLAELEAQGRLLGEIVLLPFANPLGLAQRLLHVPMGRFDLASGENFNRHYADLSRSAVERLPVTLASDPAARLAQLRAALRAACTALPAEDELKSLRKTLLGLAIDADVVLDLHCDNEAVLHLYAATALRAAAEPLARLLGAHALLLADESGDEPFDEACSTIWARLAQRLGERAGQPVELPAACLAITVELRGETDVDHALAARDAAAILDFLALRGLLSDPPRELPPLLHPATPLAGSLPVAVPSAGVVVWRCAPGAVVQAGDVLADLVDPASGTQIDIRSPATGVFYARDNRRFVPAGTRIAKIAGREAVRTGKLLSE